jgi:hypothetical protein
VVHSAALEISFWVRPGNRYEAISASLLERNPETSSGVPNDPAPLLGTAEQQLKSIGQFGLAEHLEAGAAGGIVHNSAIDDRIFRANDQFAGVRNAACRPNTCESSRMHYCSP